VRDIAQECRRKLRASRHANQAGLSERILSWSFGEVTSGDDQLPSFKPERDGLFASAFSAREGLECNCGKYNGSASAALSAIAAVESRRPKFAGNAWVILSGRSVSHICISSRSFTDRSSVGLPYANWKSPLLRILLMIDPGNTSYKEAISYEEEFLDLEGAEKSSKPTWSAGVKKFWKNRPSGFGIHCGERKGRDFGQRKRHSQTPAGG